MNSALIVELDLLILFSLLFREGFGQSLNVTRTYPVGLDGANPLVSAFIDAKNITLLCEVTLDGGNVQTQWSFIAEPNSMPTFLSFTAEGGGQELFMVTPLSDFRRNFTILTFNRSLDNAQIGCGANNEVLFMFDLKLNSKLHFMQCYSFPSIIKVSDYYLMLEWYTRMNVE